MHLLTLLLPIALLLAVICIPTQYANAQVRVMRRAVTGLVGFQFLIAIAFAIALAFGLFLNTSGPTSLTLFMWPSESGIGFSLYYDAVASLMLALVSFVGLIVSRFSIRYLDGEAAQGRYYRWLAFTLGAVSLMVIAGNLLLFFVAWVLTSFGLHRLLLHYPHRREAQRAAWTKFGISRLGDALLIAAFCMIVRAFGTLELPELYAKLAAFSESGQTAPIHTAIAWLLMLGAVTKSAQFPFHSWLPDTLETPTPVSALMHAGIVNAGGYLVIRMSPLIVQAPSAMITLTAIGAFTACFGGIVMMAQPSVKRALAYSTIAQMGFMMLQCGLGAFSAAMLHILAHSLYKAYAFLDSGNVITQALATKGAKAVPSRPWVTSACLLAAVALTTASFVSVTLALRIDVLAKPGGLVLACILCLSLAPWAGRLFSYGDRSTAFIATFGLTGLCLAYFGCYLAVDFLMASSNPFVNVTPLASFILLSIVAAFGLLFAVHVVLLNQHQPAWLAPLQVHAANGFYVDAIYRRILTPLNRR